METKTNNIVKIGGWLFAILTLITFISCEEEKFFDNLDNITLRFGGSGHPEAGEFFIRDFVPIME